MHEFMKTIISAIKSWVSGEIKDASKASVADWNQNDVNADNYVKNKTHWEETSLATIVEEQTLTGFMEMQNGIYAVVGSFIMEPVVGQMYTVVWDGVNYNVPMEDIDGIGCIGNINYGHMIPEGDIPFAIIFAEGIFVVTTSNKTHTISIMTEQNVVHKLPVKYLPDDIGVQSDWAETDENSKGFILNKPSIYNNENGNVCLTNGEKLATENYVHEAKNGVIIKDEVNGYNYVVSMKNGILVSYPATDYIRIDSMPNKTTYAINEVFKPNGMTVSAISVNGNTREIVNYTFDRVVNEGNADNFTITYIEGNSVFTTSINLELHDFSLIDFEYTANDDGTYTLDSWKGTYNGDISNKIIVPNSELIIVN